jgi:hypothetical protein
MMLNQEVRNRLRPIRTRGRPLAIPIAMYWSARTTPWLAIVLAVVILGIGFCLVGGHQHEMNHHTMSPDLCLGFLALTLAVTLLGLAEIDRLPVEIVFPVAAISVHRLDPPPKFAPIS